ncbi:hypothetical protein OQY15_14700 [Pedobacter sp. MC2016-15]|uniref:hypothetical protein n=1 Tax=Pedobacter sp. MC2016-15 TaxID=2994473 RepID=UPI002245BC66|nr:hypothetical protein [Pedobacter sp. MC2016-15]MCX2480348.1 hypothetical protein [Pedobacter sp. MC2016-15]
MKRIYLTLIILLLAMSGMAYLYFSRLNSESSYNDISLQAATANSGLVFCIHNDKSIFEILKGQDLFEKLLGEEKFRSLSLLKDLVISKPAINGLIANKDVFISFSGGKNKDINYLVSTQLIREQKKPVVLEALQAAGIKVTDTAGILRLTLNDSTGFYLGIEKNLVLLSGTEELVRAGLSAKAPEDATAFMKFIKLNNKLGKNSVGNLFIDYNKIPRLIKSVIPGSLYGNTSLLNHQDSFAALNYNFSRERLFFSGTTKLNQTSNYLNLFANTTPQKSTIDNLLPLSTANFRLYSIPDYKSWRNSLKDWFKLHKEDQKIKKTIERIEQTYRLDPEGIFPKYFKDQLITFQLQSAENLGAVNLSNGDKVKQLLIDLSTNYNEDIQQLKVPELLYCYFGEPFKKFSKPYYTIIDNNMVFANSPSTLQDFLRLYRTNELLVSTADYTDLFAQISNTASITFYVNHKNSTDIIRKNVYTPYYRHFLADKGLGNFSALIYQLNGDKAAFQTNLLINTSVSVKDDADIIN